DTDGPELAPQQRAPRLSPPRPGQSRRRVQATGIVLQGYHRRKVAPFPARSTKAAHVAGGPDPPRPSPPLRRSGERLNIILRAGSSHPGGPRSQKPGEDHRRRSDFDGDLFVSQVDPVMGEQGWSFSDPEKFEGCNPDPLYGAQYLRDIYYKADPDYRGKTVISGSPEPYHLPRVAPPTATIATFRSCYRQGALRFPACLTS
ncbi:MAG: hypothetical protein BJ554DRAFT_6645, partial [Olpidium bornovanus]